ncbi:MAG: Phospholipase D/transphosphatidylase, partial [uncultured Thiotrichaceae bacterium]
MAIFAKGKIEAYCGPPELGAEDDLEAVICDFIKHARKTLDIAVQEIDNEVIAQAILDASCKGIRVRVFIEQDYLIADSLPRKSKSRSKAALAAFKKKQWQDHSRNKKSNRDILAAMLRCGVDVKADLNPKIFHQKFIIRDYQRGRSLSSKSAVLTGSTNFTVTGCHKNLNHTVIFNSARIASIYSDEFNELVEGTFGAINQRKSPNTSTVNLSGVPVRIRFSPDDSPELEVVKQMLKTKRWLYFAIFTFSGSSGIDDAMIMLRRAGIRIRGVLDSGQGKKAWAATKWLHDKGIDVFLSSHKKMPGLGKLHHKLMVIDSNI